MAEARLRAGVIGVGHLGTIHARKYKALEGVDLVGLYDIDPARADALASELGCWAAPSLEDLLARLDIASVAVPTASHVEVGLRVVRANVHLLIEKPIAGDCASAIRLVEAAARANVLLQVGHLERFNPVFDDIHRMIAAPRFIEAHRLAPFAGRGTDTDVVHDVMIHDLDLIAFLAGDELTEIQAVGVPVLSAQVDIANARLRFASGCVANVTASRASLKRERRLRVFQRDAYVSLDFDSSTALVARRRAEAVPFDAANPMAGIDVERRSFGEADPLSLQISDFVRCVRSEAAPIVGAHDALTALEIADRICAAMEKP